MALRPGHNGSMTVVAIGNNDKDRVQIVQVTSHMVMGTDKNVVDVCNNLMERIKDRAKLMLDLPIKTCRRLDDLRELAQEERANILVP